MADPSRHLITGQNFTLSPTPQSSPTATSPHILIIGGGVTGLTSAWVLLDRGCHVTIVSKEWASYTKSQRLTSQIAGALWEFPPAVCGQHTDAISLSNSKRWCMVAYRIWDDIAADPEMSKVSGVKMNSSTFFFPCPIEEDPEQLRKMREIESAGILGFNRNPALIQEQGVNPKYGAVDAYEHLAPMIDTDVGMTWMMSQVLSKGGKMITATIYGDLFTQESVLREQYNADIIVNCTGLAGAEIAGDATCYPIRGALIRAINDGKRFPKVTKSMTITADAVHDSNEIVFIVPRNDNILLLGGLAQSHEYTLDLTLDTPAVVRMRERCNYFLPGLKDAELDPEYPLAQGLRPFRQHNVRVERELRKRDGRPSRIVHSYGQGGAGWSLSFGCAEDVASLVEDALEGKEAVPMMTVEMADSKQMRVDAEELSEKQAMAGFEGEQQIQAASLTV
jgi:D-amino-acid oxidase